MENALKNDLLTYIYRNEDFFVSIYTEDMPSLCLKSCKTHKTIRWLVRFPDEIKLKLKHIREYRLNATEHVMEIEEKYVDYDEEKEQLENKKEKNPKTIKLEIDKITYKKPDIKEEAPDDETNIPDMNALYFDTVRYDIYQEMDKKNFIIKTYFLLLKDDRHITTWYKDITNNCISNLIFLPRYDSIRPHCHMGRDWNKINMTMSKLAKQNTMANQIHKLLRTPSIFPTNVTTIDTQ